MNDLTARAAYRTAADIDTHSARRALLAALNALDKGNVVVAGNFSEAAVDMLADMQLSPSQIRSVMAPAEGPTKADKLFVLVFIGVILWLVTDWLIPTIAGAIR